MLSQAKLCGYINWTIHWNNELLVNNHRLPILQIRFYSMTIDLMTNKYINYLKNVAHATDQSKVSLFPYRFIDISVVPIIHDVF